MTVVLPLLQPVEKNVAIPIYLCCSYARCVQRQVFFVQYAETADIPVVAQRQIIMDQTVEKTVEIHQLQFIDTVIDVLIVRVVQVPQVLVVKTTVVIPQLQLVVKSLCACLSDGPGLRPRRVWALLGWLRLHNC